MAHGLESPSQKVGKQHFKTELDCIPKCIDAHEVLYSGYHCPIQTWALGATEVLLETSIRNVKCLMPY